MDTKRTYVRMKENLLVNTLNDLKDGGTKEMKKILDPKNDVVFQKLFGIKENKHILISFLNSILNLSNEDSIKDVEFEEKRLDVSFIASEKLSILDLHVVTESNMNVNVEIQLVNQYNMIKRTIFYMSKIILNQCFYQILKRRR